MKTYLISYDLKIPGRNYQGLYDVLKSFSKWGNINDSVWIIKSSKSSVEIRDYLLKYMDYNDSLFVIKTEKEAAWRNVRANSEWLKNNL